MPPVVVPPGVAPELQTERDKCTFDVEEFSEWWYGGKKNLQTKRTREKFFLEDPDFDEIQPDSYFSHEEIYEESVRRAVLLLKKLEELRTLHNDGIDNYMALLGGLLGSGLIGDGNPLGVHFVMFLPTIMGQGTPEQQGEWLGRAYNCGIVGTYAQTELGHGTFIRGLETTATYHSDTEEFVLHSPTLTSLKWWPGGLGHTANYAVVLAQLISKEQRHGIQPFIVQLRDEETHFPMPGIKIGEIGSKLGMRSVNNGYLGFDKVRVPRNNMLMKNSKLLKDGTYIKAPSAVLTYGTMMFVRVVIIKDMSIYLSKATTIVTRYSAVRRQSAINPQKQEVQIIDHLTQQHKIFPQIAKCIVFKVVSEYLWEMYNQVTAELEHGNLDRLPELHAISCCLKAICTKESMNAIEVCRMACGGHGYMHSSSFPATYGFVTAACTYEGENTVMLLQTARYLMKAWESAVQKKQLMPTVAYLQNIVRDSGKSTWCSSIPGIIQGLQSVAAGKIRLAFNNLEERKKNGYSQEDAFNLTSIELAAASEAHCYVFLVRSAYETLTKASSTMSINLRSTILNICELFAVDVCMRSLGDLVRFTTITEAEINKLQARLEELLMAIRPNAVGMVDGFDIPDKILKSALGVYDGNVYERIFEEAQKSPLNKKPINESFHKYLKPFMKSNL